MKRRGKYSNADGAPYVLGGKNGVNDAAAICAAPSDIRTQSRLVLMLSQFLHNRRESI